MQNFGKWSNLYPWIYSMERKLLLTSLIKYNRAGIPAINLQCFNSRNNNVTGSQPYLVIHHVPEAVHKDFYKRKLLSLQSQFNDLKLLLKRTHAKQFSTSSKYNNDRRSSQEDSDDPNKDPDKNKKDLAVFFAKLGFMGIFLIMMSLLIKESFSETGISEISWNEFVHNMLAKGEVEKVIVQRSIGDVWVVLHPGAIVKGNVPLTNKFRMSVPDIETFEQKLREIEDSLGIAADNRIPVIYDKTEAYISMLLVLLLVVFLINILSLVPKKMGNPFQMFSQVSKARYTLIDPRTSPGTGVRFADVAGLKEAKIEIMEVVDYLKRPQHYKVLGAKVPKGALLLGPPGCGKTMLAKALASEANVPFYSVNGSEFVEIFGGVGAARMRDLFATVRKQAPSILFIDEIDAIGGKRLNLPQAGGSASESEQTLNQLLVEMDGILSTEGVIVLASTNRAEVLDKALLRPGRFDRHILIDYPTLEERKEIFDQHLKCLVLEKEPSAYSAKLAYLTPGFSGADIANVCNEAALHAASLLKKKVDASDLAFAIDRMVAGSEKRDHTMTKDEKEIVAYHESGHALVGWLLEHTEALLKVTIVPRTSRALGFAQYKPLDQKLFTREELFDKMCMILGGRAAESLTFNKITTGAQNDLEKVTKLAYAQVQQYGMSPKVGLLSFDQEYTSTKTRKPYSKALAKLMDAEARRLIAVAYKRSEEILLENRHKLKLLAETLIKKETLTYDDVVKLIGPPPYEKKRVDDPGDLDFPLEPPPPPPPNETT